MPFPFSSLCELLNKLDENRTKSLSASKVSDLDAKTVVTWFSKHKGIIPRRGPEAVAFLSCLFPERRPDRVFGLRIAQLERIVQRAQCLGSSRMMDLKRSKTDNSLDFASCVEQVMSVTDCESRHGLDITLEELDDVLDQIAATSAFSSASLRGKVKEKYGQPICTDDLLSRVFRALKSSEAKWIVRMLSKNYSPVCVPEPLAMHQFHFLLPSLLTFQNSFEAAVKLLDEPTIGSIPFQVASDAGGALTEIANNELRPQVGVMIGRPTYEKARSIKHCCQLASQRQMSVERKYDGEYCQIHIDLNKANDIQIFSKSGKDSTRDRRGLHPVLRDCLALNRGGSKIKKQCILEGELLVWNDDDKKIEPFYKIRRHVKRSGNFIGTALDSPADPGEHLMIMFYDILLLDDTPCIRENLEKRRGLLKSLVHCISGRVKIGTCDIIDFSSSDAPKRLAEAFARAITQRWEGFVLKGCDDPYFSFDGAKPFIKLKKDYIPGLGDTADFAIVGGRRNARDEQVLGIGKLWWTSFYIGCLENKNDVCRFDAKPRFYTIDMIDLHSISKDNIRYLNRHGYFERVPFAHSIPEFDVGFDRQLQPAELFKRPFAVELMGAGFDKPSNSRYFTLRFPRMLKIHGDRSFKDTTSLEELQKMAKQCSEVPEDSMREETHWLGKLGISDYPVGPMTEATRVKEEAKKSSRKRRKTSETAFPRDDSATNQLRLD
ncbi:hypothetical protein F5884DRAFT_713747 [Xylogone sp. PMI_703]|nr:hypothetical protein F5884DRAFT_713747 [Xylogone sp. PMI_703]